MRIELIGFNKVQDLTEVGPAELLDFEADPNSRRLLWVVRIKRVLDGFSHQGIDELDIVVVKLVPLCWRS